MERLFPHHFRDKLAHRLICDLILFIKHRAGRQIRKQRVHDVVQVLLTQRGDRDDLIKIERLAVCVDMLKHLQLLYRVNFIDD